MGLIDIVLFRTLGDVLMGTTIVHAIKEKYPDSSIRFFTDPAYMDLLHNNSEIQTVVSASTYMDVYSQRATMTKADITCHLGMANHYDTCWHHNSETAGQHMIDFYAKRAKLDLKITDYNVRFTSIEPHMAMYIGLGLPEKYITIHTTSLLETKNWPMQYFNHLVIMLNKTYNLPIVQIGGPQDAPIDGTINLLGKTNIGVTNIIVQRAAFYIGVDSGSAYLAGAAKIPTFLIMGSSMGKPQVEGQFGPLVGPVGDNVHYIEPVRPHDMHCMPIPCINHCALQKPCINTIQPQQVLEVIKTHVSDMK